MRGEYQVGLQRNDDIAVLIRIGFVELEVGDLVAVLDKEQVRAGTAGQDVGLTIDRRVIETACGLLGAGLRVRVGPRLADSAQRGQVEAAVEV